MVVHVRPRPPSIPLALIAATLVLTIVAVLDLRAGGGLYRRLALIPADVWRGELWRLVTWPFVQLSVHGLLIECIAIYWFGGGLLAQWGRARLARFLVLALAAGSVGTTLLGAVVPGAWSHPHLGGVFVADTLLIAWALQFPERRVLVYYVLPLGGPVLAYGTLAVTALFALFYGVAAVLPELLGGGVAVLFVTGGQRPWWRSIARSVRAWRARRRLDVHEGDRHGGPYGAD